MGADLYLEPVFTENREQWEPLFNQAVARRDRLAEGSPERQAAQVEVERYYDRMYARGYFRDPYNDWDLLWKFGLSWWEDVIPMLDDTACLQVAQIGRLLGLLSEREPAFEDKLAELPAKDQRYFRGRYRALRLFLKEAIDRNQPIRCSL